MIISTQAITSSLTPLSRVSGFVEVRHYHGHGRQQVGRDIDEIGAAPESAFSPFGLRGTGWRRQEAGTRSRPPRLRTRNTARQ
ncbi:hypothetical protein F6R98_09385 [Candidatus Methylospira mobilis]|uniref:Uncharacterized protein n=1 Tax=Candidatus Methylospira mobilis TaxID=1808979 RepID=A0A5Q0BM31_9GAMM|nr:hypothetical protein [Candidatus Methylospira mobilis]QFY42806.1 hypothetical protein F6R98_09385 [Candidatus Methylospira mobilis]WNV03697.1 hypothetical protein RP726_14775 [Candidatus Methylospira mobilis]